MDLIIVVAKSKVECSEMRVEDQHVVSDAIATIWYQVTIALFEILVSAQRAATDFAIEDRDGFDDADLYGVSDVESSDGEWRFD